MTWKCIKPLESIKNIDDYECMVRYSLPDDFRECVITNNGGRPEYRCFDTDKAKERVLKSFLSFNRNDKETVWKLYEWKKEQFENKYVPFAIDNFGNLICFDADNDHIVFLNHENSSVENVADSFSSFFDSLY